MRNTWKKALLFTLCVLPVALAGSYFAALMSVSSAEGEIVDQMITQLGSRQAVVLVSAATPVIYALASAFFGYILAGKLGLLKKLRFEDPPIIRVLLISVLCGAILSLDAWTFGYWIPEVGESYAAAGHFDAVTWLASILSGGILEEILLRLFVMSLLAFFIWKIFRRSEAAVPTVALVIANILAALIFSALHLPATVLFFGHLSPLIVLRCFLLNGAAGLVFGRFYRKYGLQYAMLAHILLHIVSRTIWLIAF